MTRSSNLLRKFFGVNLIHRLIELYRSGELQHRDDIAVTVGILLGLFLYVILPALLGEGPFGI